ncbi:MAG: hypothetical protein IJ486_02565 [Firmicutes bacterium]|nr:hypothetical protein [Bacillota bacterium]
MDREVLKNRMKSLGISLGIFLLISFVFPFFSEIRMFVLIYAISSEVIRFVIRESNWEIISKVGTTILIVLLSIGCVILTDYPERLEKNCIILISLTTTIELGIMVWRQK